MAGVRQGHTMLVGLAALMVGGLGATMAAPAAADATDVDALAQALRVDGVVVDRVMGSGESEQAHDRLAKLVREMPFPVYVALVEQPVGLPGGDSLDATDALAGLLHRRLGDGFYVIHTVDSIRQVYSFGLGSDPGVLSLSAYSNIDALDAAMERVGGFSYGTEDFIYTPAAVEAEAIVLTAEELLEQGRGPSRGSAEYPSTLSDVDAERLSEHALKLQAVADWQPGSDYAPVRTVSPGLTTLVGGLSALVVALLLGQTLRGWPRRRAAPSPAELAAAPPDLETERVRARDLADRLATELAETDWADVADRDAAGRALTARDAVEPLLDSDDVGDLVGAQVVALVGSRDLARGRRGHGDQLVTCFFDPRHPEGTELASWRLGDGEVDVPCCPTCAARVSEGKTPQHLRLRARRRTAPYWARRDVWARTGFGSTTDFLARDVLAAREERR